MNKQQNRRGGKTSWPTHQHTDRGYKATPTLVKASLSQTARYGTPPSGRCPQLPNTTASHYFSTCRSDTLPQLPPPPCTAYRNKQTRERERERDSKMDTRTSWTAVLLLLLSAAVAPALTQGEALHEEHPAEGPPQPKEPTTETSADDCIPGASEHDLNVPESSANLSSITDFGLDLFRELYPYNTTERNFFFSPYSVWSALSLAYFGSKGQTEEELAAALGVTDKVTALKSWRALEFLYAMRQANKSSYTFNVANRAYFDESVQLRPCIEQILTSELATVDFTKPDVAAAEINSFVSNTTKGRIQDLVTPAHVAGARMVLANAAFFKGVWLYQFKKSATAKGLFYSSFEDYTFVDMMRQKGNFRYGKEEEEEEKLKEKDGDKQN
ncbi:leukocyte elastase inhibitor B-like isoform X2 [Eriocheir sinensis]|uniref:leukocyte elastase inhibitor B-like isoform X2 n=1 Tax=Eriocheir sinensis TaxID=95602 RepID=UPI0021C9D87B|nr:leukocyte elastase inhibitor B-like isoform X2 [Eriocheir sinensis]